jgi:hypothetical protein
VSFQSKNYCRAIFAILRPVFAIEFVFQAGKMSIFPLVYIWSGIIVRSSINDGLINDFSAFPVKGSMLKA